MTTEVSISIVPIIRVIVNFSLNNIIPIIILTIGSKVPRIDVEEAPIIFNAFTNKPIETIVEINEIPIIDVVVSMFTGKINFPLSKVKIIKETPAKSEK